MTGRVSSRHPASSILGVTLTPCAEGPCETGCLALLPDISFFWKRCGPCPPVLESTYLSKSAPPSAGNSQRRRGRRWRKHRANVHLHSLPRIPRSPMPPAGGKTCGYTPQEGEKCGCEQERTPSAHRTDNTAVSAAVLSGQRVQADKTGIPCTAY